MSGYVTFKFDKVGGREAILRSPDAARELPPSNAADAAWQVQIRPKSGHSPSPHSDVYFSRAGKFSGSNIEQLSLISESEYEQAKRNSNVARFAPHKAFEDAAKEASGI